MPEWLNETEQRAWRGLLTVTSRLDAELNRRLQETSGLSQADYAVLVALSEAADGKLRAFEVARSLSWEQSRLSHHLARMQKRGLIDRQECPSDRRGAFVVLTADGRSAIETAAPAHVEAVRELMFEGLSDAQVRTLASVTEKVLKRLDSCETATT